MVAERDGAVLLEGRFEVRVALFIHEFESMFFVSIPRRFVADKNADLREFKSPAAPFEQHSFEEPVGQPHPSVFR